MVRSERPGESQEFAIGRHFWPNYANTGGAAASGPGGMEELVSSHRSHLSVSMMYGFLLLGCFFFKGVKMRCTVLHLLHLLCATMHFGPCPKIKWCLI